MPIPAEYADLAENALGVGDSLLLRLEERTSSVPPSDATGHYGDFLPPTGQTAPTPTTSPLETMKGIGLRFGFGTAIEGAAVSGYAGLDVGIAVMLRWDFTAQAASGEPATVVCQGGRADAFGWRLVLEVVNGALRIGRVRLSWETATGTDVDPAGPEFVVPDGSFAIYASREYTVSGWVVRYVIGEQDAGSVVQALGTVGSVTAAPVRVGGRPSGLGTAFDQHFRGTIDALHVMPRPITFEEATIDSWRLMRGGHAMWQAVRELAPQGTIPRHSEAYVQRSSFQPDGASWALVRARARRIRGAFYPDKAWGAALRAWEHWTRTQLPSGSGIAARRAALIEHFTSARDGSDANVKRRLAAVLGRPAPGTDLQVTRYGPEWSDTFDPPTMSGNYITAGHNASAWISHPGNGTITEPAGGNDYVEFTSDGTFEGRYDSLLWGGAPGGLVKDPLWYVRFIGGRGVRTRLRCRVPLLTIPDGAVAGFMFGSRLTDDWIWIGLMRSGGNVHLAGLKYLNGFLDTNATVLTSTIAITVAPWWLEAEHLGTIRQGAEVGMGTFRIRVAATEGGLSGATFSSTLDASDAPEGLWDWAGLGIGQPSSIATLTGAMTVRFADWWQRSPAGPRSNTWHVFRDPVLGGTYDLPGARGILERIRPAHEYATAVDHRKGLYTDDATTLLDRDLIGT